MKKLERKLGKPKRDCDIVFCLQRVVDGSIDINDNDRKVVQIYS